VSRTRAASGSRRSRNRYRSFHDNDNSNETERCGPEESLRLRHSNSRTTKMCFFDRLVWDCGFWQWSHFREQCDRECRLGDTCGRKQAFSISRESGPCNVCVVLDAKQQRIERLDGGIRDIFIKTPTLLRDTDGHKISSDKATCAILRLDDRVRQVAREMVRAWKYHRDNEGQASFAAEVPRATPAEIAIRDIAFESWTTPRDLFDKIAARVYRCTDKPRYGYWILLQLSNVHGISLIFQQ
jgi:hypothetical protein